MYYSDGTVYKILWRPQGEFPIKKSLNLDTSLLFFAHYRPTRMIKFIIIILSESVKVKYNMVRE
jgi:hypothetical protein